MKIKRLLSFISVLVFMSHLLAHTQLEAIPDKVFYQKCHSDDDDNFMTQIIDNTTNKIEHKFIAYEDELCQTPYLSFRRIYNKTQSTENSISSTSFSSEFVPLSKEVAQALNQINFCHFNRWQENVIHDVTGLKCGDYQHLKKDQIKIFSFKTDPLQKNNFFIDDDPVFYSTDP